MYQEIRDRNMKVGKLLGEIREERELWKYGTLDLAKLAVAEGSISFETAQEYVFWWFAGIDTNRIPIFGDTSLDAIASIVSCVV
jgi:hypothetical protein